MDELDEAAFLPHGPDAAWLWDTRQNQGVESNVPSSCRGTASSSSRRGASPPRPYQSSNASSSISSGSSVNSSVLRNHMDSSMGTGKHGPPCASGPGAVPALEIEADKVSCMSSGDGRSGTSSTHGRFYSKPSAPPSLDTPSLTWTASSRHVRTNDPYSYLSSVEVMEEMQEDGELITVDQLVGQQLFQCPLEPINECAEKFEYEDQWRTHVAAHFAPNSPPKFGTCPSCGKHYSAEQGGWDAMMDDLANHFQSGWKMHPIGADRALFDYMCRKGILPIERWKDYNLNPRDARLVVFTQKQGPLAEQREERSRRRRAHG